MASATTAIHTRASTAIVHRPNRRPVLDSVLTFFSALSLIVVFARVAVARRTKRRLVLSDYLIGLSMALGITANSCSTAATSYGNGFHMNDPSMTKPGLRICLKLIFTAQVTNILSMFFLKASISAFLLPLNFSPKYQKTIWISVVWILLFNFAFPVVTLFASCKPLSLRWDRDQPGTCWSFKLDSVAGYLQGGTNIVTDIVFSAAPVLYLASVQLPRSTQWGLRAVFLFCLIGTICSIIKLTELHVLETSKDFLWDAVDLTLLSAAEVGIGIVAACLPPLRSFFNTWLRRIFPSTPSKPDSPAQLSDLRTLEMPKPAADGPAQIPNDCSSERLILPRREDRDTRNIVKTIDFNIRKAQS
ncbi:hypothetical protein K461DRAFT_9914 [Myriangium duriaei CBS 260.36]|uniref:Rhodopsin domain-containing protein n=1 Tax=Myriangium duriaei CBS 260.36 TaxID=1168546 RepID=A0A9P4J909_9PEZI|nr:hypothetical protein K461DRAFT_9914 [Myriangium duriaei CBS 260.36]